MIRKVVLIFLNSLTLLFSLLFTKEVVTFYHTKKELSIVSNDVNSQILEDKKVESVLPTDIKFSLVSDSSGNVPEVGDDYILKYTLSKKVNLTILHKSKIEMTFYCYLKNVDFYIT